MLINAAVVFLPDNSQTKQKKKKKKPKGQKLDTDDTYAAENFLSKKA
jgi:hypothetical protein